MVKGLQHCFLDRSNRLCFCGCNGQTRQSFSRMIEIISRGAWNKTSLWNRVSRYQTNLRKDYGVLCAQISEASMLTGVAAIPAIYTMPTPAYSQEFWHIPAGRHS